MNKHAWRLLLAAAPILCGFAPIQGGAMTLKDCVITTIKNNPGLASERHLVNAYVADITKKRSTTLPYFSSELQAYELNGMPVSPWIPAGAFDPNNPYGRRSAHWAPVGLESLDVVYPIIYQGSWFGLGDPPVVAAARAQVTQEEAATILSEQKLVFTVVSDFVNAASYRQQAEIYDRLLGFAKSQLDIVNAQLKLGHKLPQDAEMLQAEVAALESAASAVRQGAIAYAADLEALARGADLRGQDEGLVIDNNLPAIVPLPPMREFLDQVMPSHPALRVESTKIAMARDQLHVDQANGWPTATFTTSFGSAQDFSYFSGNNDHIRPTGFESYLTLNIPLYDFGGRQAAVDESSETLDAEKESLQQLGLEIRSAITQAYGQVLQGTAKIATLDSQLARDTANLDLIKARNAQGEADEITLLSAQMAPLQDTLLIENAELAQRLTYAELQNLSGGNWHWAP